MKTAAWAASIGLVAAVPVLYKTPERLAALYAGAAAAYFVLKPLAPSVDVEELDPNRRSLTTDRFSEDKIPEDIDTVIIGSGMSGLSCAAILARCGKKVLVLEQHDRTGGGSHEYELGKENYRFDAGLHYTVPESGLLLQLCTGTQDQPVRMDPLGEPKGKDGSVVYERVYVGEGEPMFEVKMHQKHMGELRRRFPDNQADIDSYIREAAEAVDSVPLYVFSRLMPRSWQRFFGPILLRTWNKQAGRTIQDALNNITQNKKLQAYFSSLWLDTGHFPTLAPSPGFKMHAPPRLITSHHITSHYVTPRYAHAVFPALPCPFLRPGCGYNCAPPILCPRAALLVKSTIRNSA